MVVYGIICDESDKARLARAVMQAARDGAPLSEVQRRYVAAATKLAAIDAAIARAPETYAAQKGKRRSAAYKVMVAATDMHAEQYEVEVRAAAA